MALRQQLDVDLKAAMLAKDQAKTSALRMIKAAVRNREIDEKKTLDDVAMVSILSAIKKQREDAIAQYKLGARADLVAKEEHELAIISSYLPQALTPDEIEAIIAEAITQSGAASSKDMGKVMKLVVAKTTGRADGKMVSEQVKARLQSLGAS